MTAKQREEQRIRDAFERYAKEGIRPIMYGLEQCANGEYVSSFTQVAWSAFKAGWDRKGFPEMSASLKDFRKDSVKRIHTLRNRGF